VNNLDAIYQQLNIVANSKIKVLQDEYDAKVPLFEGINDIIKKYRTNKSLEIEECVRELQNLIWKNKNLIWKKTIPKHTIDILRPDIIFREVLGYGYIESDSFAVLSGEEITEVAGVIDQSNKLVMISAKYSPEVRRFTAAHELAHAILHDQPILHRDIPSDCIGTRKSRDYTEKEADKFSTYFLMPDKLIIKEFKKIYSTSKFILNEDFAFKFGARTPSDLRNECKNEKGLARKLASTTLYNNYYYTPLSKLFNVSIEAMAIRLIELDLIKY
jgi:Zn-dependent peptidase ImmA (M78 family)